MTKLPERPPLPTVVNAKPFGFAREHEHERNLDLNQSLELEFQRAVRETNAQIHKHPIDPSSNNDPIDQIKDQFKTLTHRQMKRLCQDLWATRPNGPNRESIELVHLPEMFDAWAYNDVQVRGNDYPDSE